MNISLRPLTSLDVSAFMTWGSDPVVTQPLFWDPYPNEAAAKVFLQSIVEPHEYFMAICLDGEVVGAVTLDRGKGPRGSHRAELGYVLARSQWGKGIATEAVRQAVAWASQKLHLHRIEAFVDPDNVGSIRVLEKAGLIREGVLKSYVMHRCKIRDRFVYATYL